MKQTVYATLITHSTYQLRCKVSSARIKSQFIDGNHLVTLVRCNKPLLKDKKQFLKYMYMTVKPIQGWFHQKWWCRGKGLTNKLSLELGGSGLEVLGIRIGGEGWVQSFIQFPATFYFI